MGFGLQPSLEVLLRLGDTLNGSLSWRVPHAGDEQRSHSGYLPLHSLPRALHHLADVIHCLEQLV